MHCVCHRTEPNKSRLFFRSRMASYHLGVGSIPFLKSWQSIIWKRVFSVNKEDDFFPLYFSFYMKRSIWHLAIVSLLFGSSSFSLSLSLLLKQWETQGKRGIQYQPIDPRPSRQRKNLGSGAAQFQLDTAIDRILYQPLPWQLAEQGQSPAVYLHLSTLSQLLLQVLEQWNKWMKMICRPVYHTCTVIFYVAM